MFCKKSDNSKIPDISKWNTNKVTTMECLFNECSSLKTLPDISKWNIQNVTDINYMFYKCLSLIALSDISNCKTYKIIK